jgi:hypothetical protein
LSDIADYRFLDAEQILALHPGSLRNTQNRLSLLYHLGYVDRPPSQKLFARPGSPLIYSLAEKGAEALSREKMPKPAFPYLAHAMMISQFRSIVSLALRQSPDKPELVRWVQGYELKDLISRNGARAELVPDAFFSIEQGGDPWHFFLEADRATMTKERFLNKMKIYWQWRYDERILKALNISRYFRVLTIAPNKNRTEGLRKITKLADDKKEGKSIFLFLSESEYSLQNPEAVLSPVWLSAKDDTRHAILE